MHTREREYEYEGVVYGATITYKRMRSMTLRYDAEHKHLRVSVPTLTPLFEVDRFVKKYLPKVTKKAKRKASNYDGTCLYVFGQKQEMGELEPSEIDAYYKKIGLPYVKKRVDHYSALMGVNPPYKVRMRTMKRTYGSNSRKTHTLTFQGRLMAFCPEIIDSVVVHELAHHFQFNHSKKFYAVVYRYCPEYDKWRKKLIHDQFAG